MLVSPRKLVIPPGGTKMIRFITRHTGLDKDEIYRATVTPIKPPAKAQGRLGVKIVVAYGVLVIIRPTNMKPQLEAKRTGTRITFRNLGNTNVELRSGSQCDPQRPDSCKELSGQRVYAGAVWKQDLPYDGPLQFTYRVGGEHYARVFQ
jgi:P pilus assembly chaperone PapD